MKRTDILLDSSAIIALVVQKDAHHQDAQSLFASNEHAQLLITVFEEILAVLHHRFGHSLARKVGNMLLSNPNIDIQPINTRDLIEINDLWNSLPANIDFVDASIMWAHRKNAVPIATFDDHFRKNNCKTAHY